MNLNLNLDDHTLCIGRLWLRRGRDKPQRLLRPLPAAPPPSASRSPHSLTSGQGQEGNVGMKPGSALCQTRDALWVGPGGHGSAGLAPRSLRSDPSSECGDTEASARWQSSRLVRRLLLTEEKMSDRAGPCAVRGLLCRSGEGQALAHQCPHGVTKQVTAVTIVMEGAVEE